MGGGDDHFAFVCEDDVAVFAHDFDVQMPEGGSPGRRANQIHNALQGAIDCKPPVPNHQLMQQLLAEGKRIWCPRWWIADKDEQLGDARKYLATPLIERA